MQCTQTNLLLEEGADYALDMLHIKLAMKRYNDRILGVAHHHLVLL